MANNNDHKKGLPQCATTEKAAVKAVLMRLIGHVRDPTDHRRIHKSNPVALQNLEQTKIGIFSLMAHTFSCARPN